MLWHNAFTQSFKHWSQCVLEWTPVKHDCQGINWWQQPIQHCPLRTGLFPPSCEVVLALSFCEKMSHELFNFVKIWVANFYKKEKKPWLKPNERSFSFSIYSKDFLLKWPAFKAIEKYKCTMMKKVNKRAEKSCFCKRQITFTFCSKDYINLHTSNSWAHFTTNRTTMFFNKNSIFAKIVATSACQT